jgi:tetratricopeptide (TPR) repeat protein
MKNVSSHPLFFFGVGIVFILFVHMVVSQFDTVDQELNQAYAAYQEGVEATNIAARKEGFNKSLSIYKHLETLYSPDMGNGKLYFNIANDYFQLGEFSQAVLYYLRAENLNPRDTKVQNNLEKAYNKLGIKVKTQDAVLNKIFFFHHAFSLPEKLQLITLFSVILFTLASFYIWWPFLGLKTLLAIVSIAIFLLLSSIFYTQFISPSYAVILKANLLYQDAGKQFAKVLDDPLLPGSKVEVLEVLQNGKWLKILTPDGAVGFIPYESLQII